MLLASTVLPLEGEGTPDAEHVRGWFYGLLADIDPAVHDQQGPKPFTLGVTRGKNTALRITFLKEDLHAAISPKLWGAVGTELRLGGKKYLLRGVVEEDHPLARLSTYAQIFQGPPTNDYPLRFRSPTFFKRHGDHYPLPEPRLVFGSLAARFAAFAPVALPPNLQDTFDRLTVRTASIRTRPIEHAVRAVGFTGRVVFHLPGAYPKESRWLSALWRFAFFAGVGAKTTMGFGQVTPYRPAPVAPAAMEEEADGAGRS